jgi:hypothetical protein
MIEGFVSRPTRLQPVIERRLRQLYQLMEELGLHVNTLGQTHAPIRNPFDEMLSLMRTCRCTVVLGLPHLAIERG